MNAHSPEPKIAAVPNWVWRLELIMAETAQIVPCVANVPYAPGKIGKTVTNLAALIDDMRSHEALAGAEPVVPLDDALIDFRLAQHVAKNMPGASIHKRRSDQPLPVGVHLDKGKYRARVTEDGRRIQLGTFATAELAGERLKAWYASRGKTPSVSANPAPAAPATELPAAVSGGEAPVGHFLPDCPLPEPERAFSQERLAPVSDAALIKSGGRRIAADKPITVTRPLGNVQLVPLGIMAFDEHASVVAGPKGEWQVSRPVLLNLQRLAALKPGEMLSTENLFHPWGSRQAFLDRFPQIAGPLRDACGIELVAWGKNTFRLQVAA